MSRCSAAKGSCTGLSLVGPTEVKAHKSFLLTGGSLKIEIKNIWLIVVTLYNTMQCPVKVNSNTIELTVHTSCYCVLDLLSVNGDLIFRLKTFVSRLLKKPENNYVQKQQFKIDKFVKIKKCLEFLY